MYCEPSCPWLNSDYYASGGFIQLDAYDLQHMVGSFDLTFPDGSHLNGTFNVNVGTFGETSVSGSWQGIDASGINQYAYFWTQVNTLGSIVLDFWDDQFSTSVWFTMNGQPSAGGYTVGISGQAWGTVSARITGGAEAHEIEMTSGTLSISRYNQTGVAGTFQVSLAGGGTMNGDFDIPFPASSP